MAKKTLQERTIIREKGFLRAGLVVRSDESIDDAESFLAVMPNGDYLYQCFCGTTNRGSVRGLSSTDPTIMCGDYSHSGEIGFGAVGVVRNYQEKPRSFLLYAIKRSGSE